MEYMYSFIHEANNQQAGAIVIALVNKNTNGTGCWPMTPTMTVLVSLWIGFCSHHAVFVNAITILILDRNKSFESFVVWSTKGRPSCFNT